MLTGAKSAERCKRCVLPLNQVRHNQEGICIHCQIAEKAEEPDWEKSQRLFGSLIKSFVGKGKKYDFLVPITGGKDSTYVLYYLTKVVGVSRILTFTWDHLFHRPTSWENMKNAVSASGVDFYIYRIFDAETTRSVHRGLFKLFGHTCTACFLLQPAIILNQAIRHGVPFIISGRNPGQAFAHGTADPTRPRSSHPEVENRFNTIFQVLRKALLPEFGNRTGEVLEEIVGGIHRAWKQRQFPWPHYVDMGAFMNWYKGDETSFLKTLEDAFQFKKPSDTFTRTSCQLERLRGFQEFNIGKMDKAGYAAELSHFIRSGILSREIALNEMKKLGMAEEFPEEALIYLQELGLSKEEFTQRLHQPIPYFIRAHFFLDSIKKMIRRFRSR